MVYKGVLGKFLENKETVELRPKASWANGMLYQGVTKADVMLDIGSGEIKFLVRIDTPAGVSYYEDYNPKTHEGYRSAIGQIADQLEGVRSLERDVATIDGQEKVVKGFKVKKDAETDISQLYESISKALERYKGSLDWRATGVWREVEGNKNELKILTADQEVAYAAYSMRASTVKADLFICGALGYTVGEMAKLDQDGGGKLFGGSLADSEQALKLEPFSSAACKLRDNDKDAIEVLENEIKSKKQALEDARRSKDQGQTKAAEAAYKKTKATLCNLGRMFVYVGVMAKEHQELATPLRATTGNSTFAYIEDTRTGRGVSVEGAAGINDEVEKVVEQLMGEEMSASMYVKVAAVMHCDHVFSLKGGEYSEEYIEAQYSRIVKVLQEEKSKTVFISRDLPATSESIRGVSAPSLLLGVMYGGIDFSVVGLAAACFACIYFGAPLVLGGAVFATCVAIGAVVGGVANYCEKIAIEQALSGLRGLSVG